MPYLSKFPQAKLEELASTELNYRELAEIFGVSKSTVWRRLRNPYVKKPNAFTGKIGPEHPCWKGGKSMQYGYIRVYDPKTRHTSFEHRLVWERANNRKVPKDWVVHHLNGIRSDNRPSNLLAMHRKDHNKLIGSFQNRIKELEDEVIELIKTLERYQLRDRYFIYQRN